MPRQPATRRLTALSRVVLVLGAVAGLLAPAVLAVQARIQYRNWLVSIAGDMLPVSRQLYSGSVGPAYVEVSAEGVVVVLLLVLVAVLALVGTRAAAYVGIGVGVSLLGLGALGIVRFGFPVESIGWTSLMAYYVVPGVLLLVGGIAGAVSAAGRGSA